MAEESKEREKAMSPEDEIRELERKLEEKKRAYAGTRTEKPEEKEMLREVLREHIEKLAKPPPSRQAHDLSSLPPQPGKKKKADDRTGSTQALEERVRALIELALTKTIADAVRLAQTETPYLLDELHDHLVDDYYEKLIQLRKLEQL